MIARVLSLSLLLVLYAGIDGAAQTFRFVPPIRSAEPGLHGKVIVKVKRELFNRGVEASDFGEATKRYGIYHIEPWIEPKLLWYGPMGFKSGPRESGAASLARIMVVEYSSLDNPETVADAIGKMRDVEYAEPIYPRTIQYAPNDPGVTNQWYLDAIKVKQAWDIARADSTIIIAITDTGIERLHQDLKDAIWYNPEENGTGPDGDKRSDGKDNDDNGLVDDWWGYDFAGALGVSPDNDPSGIGEEHGTQVAGIAGATGNNNTGISGVAFGVKLMAVKVGDDRAFPNNRIYNGAKGILYAARMGAKIINCSWGGVNRSRSEEDVVRHVVHDQGLLVVAAAGNDGDESIYYPASYPGVLSIASLNEGKDKASFSNYTYRVDLSAPGTDLYSTIFGSAYGYDRGTSFSTPMVSGVAALLCKRYPGISGEKMAEMLRSTTDDVTGTLNPAYAGKMGTGELNALRALQDGGTVVSARMVDYTIDEATPDGAADAGETIRIRANIKNILASAPAVSVTMTSITDATIQINGPALELGAMSSGEARISPDTVFQFTIPPSTTPNTDLVFKLTVTTKDRINEQYITLRAVPTYLTTDHNDIAATFNSTGNIGHNGLEQDEGEGFSFDGSDDLLFHGGVMIGTSATRLADVVRVGRSFEGVSDGFRMEKPYRLRLALDSNVEIGSAIFSDAHLPEEIRVGVDVQMTTYEYQNPSSSNILLVVYRIRNVSGAALEGLRCGLYLDWDVSSSSYSDQVGYDASHLLAYQRNTSATTTSPYVGATLVSPQDIAFYAVSNDADSANAAFYAWRKWMMMTSGIHENNTIDDMAMVISGGPVTIAPNAYTEVAFALLAASDFDSLRIASDVAKALYKPSSVGTPGGSGKTLLAVARPNPFADITRLNVILPHAGQTSVAIYNLHGEQVASLFDGKLPAGSHEIPFDATTLPDGVYLYEVRSGDMVQYGKLVKSR